MTSIDRASGIIEQKNDGASKISTEFASKVLHFLLVIVRAFSFPCSPSTLNPLIIPFTSQLIARKSHELPSAFLITSEPFTQSSPGNRPRRSRQERSTSLPCQRSTTLFPLTLLQTRLSCSTIERVMSFLYSLHTLACIILLGGVQSQSSIHHLLRGSQSESFSQVLWRHTYFAIRGEFTLQHTLILRHLSVNSFANYHLISIIRISRASH